MVTFIDPKVTYCDPKMTHSDPYLHLPHLAHFWPLVRCNETSGGWWWEGGNKL